MPDLSILIPAHNEENNLAQLINEIVAVMAQAKPAPDYEIVVVDDGSTDGTSAEILPLTSSLGVVRLIAHARRAGKSAALKTGFDRCEGEWIATLDGDGQNDPADLAWRKDGPRNSMACGRKSAPLAGQSGRTDCRRESSRPALRSGARSLGQVSRQVRPGADPSSAAR